jgi:hypothetical protein
MLRLINILMIGGLALGLAACGDGTSSDGSGAGNNGVTSEGVTTADDGDAKADGGQTEFVITIGDWTMAPGKETTRCIQKRLGNTQAIMVRSITTQLSEGSHHLIIYRSNADDEILEPQVCQPFVETLGGATVPLMVTEIPEETLRFPEGTGIELAANQMIRIEAHYLNYFPNDIVAHADITFEAYAETSTVEKVDMLFFGHGNIYLAPGEEHTSDWHYFDVPNGAKVFALTGHTHAYGTLVEIRTAAGLNDPGEQIYPGEKPFVWSEAPIEQFDPPFEFDSGRGLQMRCSWKNTSKMPVYFGQSAKDEMCFLWAYYYPSQGYRLCAVPFFSCSDDG